MTAGIRAVALTHVFPRAEGDPSAPFLLTWATALRDHGANVSVVAPHDAGLPLRHDIAGVPVRLVRYGPDRMERLAYRGEMHELVRSPTGAPLLANLVRALAAATRAEVRARDADLLHVHWWVPGAIAARLARVRVPVVCTVHGTDVALLEKRPWLARLARWALDRADRVEAVSADLAERLQRVTGRRADAINPMPLDPVIVGHQPHEVAGPEPTVANGSRSDPTHVVAVGRLVRAKGFHDLVRACARVPHALRVTIVGDGPEAASLRALAAELGVQLTLAGRLDRRELAEVYRTADVVVQASYDEGLGLVAVEASVLGIPVVVTDSGGARDVVDPSRLVRPGDIHALATRIAEVAADPEGARSDVTDLSERLWRQFSPAAAAARTLDGWRAASSGRGG